MFRMSFLQRVFVGGLLAAVLAGGDALAQRGEGRGGGDGGGGGRGGGGGGGSSRSFSGGGDRGGGGVFARVIAIVQRWRRFRSLFAVV
jgi:hypothetical protein